MSSNGSLSISGAGTTIGRRPIETSAPVVTQALTLLRPPLSSERGFPNPEDSGLVGSKEPGSRSL